MGDRKGTRPHLGQLVPLAPEAEARAESFPTPILWHLTVSGQRNRPQCNDIGVPGAEEGQGGAQKEKVRIFLAQPRFQNPPCPGTDPGLETSLLLTSESKAHKILKAQLLALGQAGERRPLRVSIEFSRNQHDFTGNFLENLPW